MGTVIIGIAVIGLIWLLVHTLKYRETLRKPQASERQELAEYPDEYWIEKRGRLGEEEVQRILARLPETEYIVLNDVLLPAGKGLTQIDHVVVSLYGIFVIEAKNYKGKIYGTHDSEKWTQYVDGEEYNFRNPIKQNIAHVMAIERLTHLSSRYIVPLVVFTGSATLKVLDCDEAIYDGMLYETICQYQTELFTPRQMTYYARIIDERIEENRETKSEHINEVRERIIEWDQEVMAGRCPRCDGVLIRRKGKYGEFFGCSNYPKCKYTKGM